MANIANNLFSEEYLKSGSMFLVECLSEYERNKLKEDWLKISDKTENPWWKWCLENVNVSYK